MRDSEFREKGHYFPYSYLKGFLQFLWRNRESVRIVTYNDLRLDEDEDYKNCYKDEYAAWTSDLKAGRLDGSKIYVLLQHDVDRLPDRTHAALQDEESLGLKSNVMIFNHKIERSILKSEGRIVFTPYEVDWEELKRLQQRGFVVGYHSNAVERAKFDWSEALTIFLRDLQELREEFGVRYFSPHGGVRDGEGRSNAALEPPDETMRVHRWVQNRFTVRFAGTFSDGAISGVKRDPEGRDLREFVKTWKRGYRYRVLLHPQYYNERFTPSKMLQRAEWYRELCEAASQDPDYDPWVGVHLSE